MEVAERLVPPGYARGTPLPWWVKLGVKMGLAALGLHGARARGIGLAEPSFDHADAGKLVDVPRGWLDRAGEAGTLLELGPGRMVTRAPVLAALGFARIWYLDAVDSAPRDAAPYREAARLAREAGLAPPDLAGCADREAVLRACNAALLTGGAAALDVVPDAGVDLIVSEAVLEHVRRDELAPLLAALRRVTAPGGRGLHWIDLHDHLGGGLQHLRFGDAFWESRLVARAGVYVNRLGLSAHLAAFRAAGFEVVVRDALVWPERPAGPDRAHPDARRGAADDRVCLAALETRVPGRANRGCR